jgi:hypothetical protein
VYDNYGDLAGFANFAGANDTSEAPVVRYQDLHRTHAPASAGLAVYGSHPAPPPEFGADPMVDEENLDGYGDVAYGDVAYGDVAYGDVAYGQAGVQPLPVPTRLPAYAGSYGYGAYPAPKPSPSASDLEDYPELKKAEKVKGRYVSPSDDIKAYVMVLQSRLITKKFLAATDSKGNTNIDGIFGDATETAVKAFQESARLTPNGQVGWDTWLALYGLSKPTTKTSRTEAEASGKSDSAFWRALQASSGLVTGREDTQAANLPSDTPDEKAGPDWGKIALWSGVAIGGIALTYVIVRAVRNKE